MEDPGTGARERLLDAATQLAGTLGRDALTVERLTALAGVSEADFHALFDDPSACLLAAHDRWLDRAQSGMTPADPPTARSLESLLQSGLDVLLTCLADRPDVARLCLVEAPAATRDARERTVARLQEAFAGHAARMGTRFDPPVVPLMAAGGIYDAVQRAAHAGETERLRDLGPELAHLWAPVLVNAARQAPSA